MKTGKTFGLVLGVATCAIACVGVSFFVQKNAVWAYALSALISLLSIWYALKLRRTKANQNSPENTVALKSIEPRSPHPSQALIDPSYAPLELFSSGVAVFDSDMRLVFVNSAYKKITGLGDQEIHQNNTFPKILDLLRRNRKLPEVVDFLAYKDEQIRLFSTLTEFVQDLICLPNGLTLRYIISPNPLGGIITVFEDITDKINTERQYNMLISVQKETLSHLFEGVMVFGSNNRLNIINPAAQRIWPSLQDINVMGMHISEVVENVMGIIDFSDDRDEFKSGLISNLTDRLEKQGNLILKNGNTVRFAYMPLPDGAHLHSYIDITDSHKLEALLFEKNKLLEHVVQAKNDFIARASFEFHEPLSTVIGFTQLLISQHYGQLNDKQYSYVQGISEGSQRLSTLIENMIKLTSRQIERANPNYSIFKIKDLFNNSLERVYQRASEKGIKINAASFPRKSMEADRELMKQAISTLLLKFIKSAKNGSIIDLKTEIISEDLNVQISCNAVVFNKVDKVLHRTEQGPDAQMHGYNSVSLLLLNHIIRMHSGSVVMESNGKDNTTIKFSVPLNRADSSDE
ncbi:MAG: PAS-domain containing protein [Holosporales bacterium]|nr:PAS-domain containing protein [Holosporales bacterium]